MTRFEVKTTRLAIHVLALTIGMVVVEAAPSPPDAATDELRALQSKVKAFRTIAVKRSAGDVTLTETQSLTIASLRGVRLDASPPALVAVPEYDPRQTDTWQSGKAPYEAKGIKPFRFQYYNCEFNYGGWHNLRMTDYASTHGFNIVYPYDRSIDAGTHLPRGTMWLTWGGQIDWHEWLETHDLPSGRYDKLAELDLVKLHVQEGVFKRVEPPQKLTEIGDYLMIDMEHGVLAPEKLREQDWYPQSSSAAKRRAFERAYYDGYAQTYISAVEAARLQGWKNISLYGWAPYGRTWGGLEKPLVAPGSNFAWSAFGEQIYDAVDLVNNSVYCFYWSPQNVAYVLANIDANMEMLASMSTKKPVRPYFWTLLHGGGGGWRWWSGQPLPNEEQRAVIAMAFFTGIDGFDNWNWSGTGNHHTPADLLGESKDYFASASDVMLTRGFRLLPERATTDAKPERFDRYDVLHIVEANKTTGNVRFQKIRPGEENHGVGDHQPVFSMSVKKLTPCLRAKSEPVAAMIEGMALVKPFEYILRHGQVMIDVPARTQFRDTLPIVRRVKLGNLHVLITYDPGVVHGDAPRRIVLEDFDGCPGLTLSLPADDETRIFVLEMR